MDPSRHYKYKLFNNSYKNEIRTSKFIYWFNCYGMLIHLFVNGGRYHMNKLIFQDYGPKIIDNGLFEDSLIYIKIDEI